ncbi:flagellar basal body-associated FliL family protein [sulfur-oxidizing endosymbiont of Gigantopelta aegis]|uniref:flagellar basal body-associated FliL family protein n=1 Tax=sulfur-oxidizing endosymbiont of Gigantopelta aegis TaxID=2794934 RepID=UPI0018DCB2D2|nr:flagellar basal body-associated FliL family protein [sulfur-oxidizing endosymbiont of Gigantopelta aegis]
MLNQYTSGSSIFKHSARFILLLMLAFVFTASAYAEEDEEVDDTKYYELSPPFVVNLQTSERRMRFLQVRLQVLGSPEAIEAVQLHNAPLRDIIITALSEQTRESVNTPKKKKALQEKVQTDVQTVLKELTGKKQIEGLYFTNFVIQ